MNPKTHTMFLDSRSTLNITAVDDVVSFDEGLVTLSVGETVVNISGEELSIKTLSLENGEVTIEGKISAIVYFDGSPRKKRLFGR